MSSGWGRIAAGRAPEAKNVDRMAHQATTSLLSSGISRRNPEDEYELIHKIGSGTYGDVYKVRHSWGGERDSLSSSSSWKCAFLSANFRFSQECTLPGGDNFRF